MIYLDNAATTYPKPESVYQRTEYAQRNLAFNSGRGSYRASREATKVIESARFRLGRLLNAKSPERIVFSPSATVALNQIMDGLSYSEYMHIYVSPFEHNAVMRTLYRLQKKFGFQIEVLPFDSATQKLQQEALAAKFALARPDYVFMTHVSNVTGVILPIRLITQMAKNYGATVIIDGAQSLGLIPLDLREEQFDYLVFAGHKNLYSHFGVGGFICNSDIKLERILTGGTGSDSLNLEMPQELPLAYEPASHNAVALASLDASLEWLEGIGVETILKKKQGMTAETVKLLRTLHTVTLYKPAEPLDHVSVISFNLEGYSAEELGLILDEDYGIAVRSGYHCAPLVHNFLGTNGCGGTVRVGLGYFNTKEDVERLYEALAELEGER